MIMIINVIKYISYLDRLSMKNLGVAVSYLPLHDQVVEVAKEVGQVDGM